MNPIQAAIRLNRSAPYVRTSATSAAAAVGIEPEAGTKRALVLAFIRGRGALGATDEEIQIGLPMAQNTERPRRVELVEFRLIKDSGYTRQTKGRRQAVVWVAA